MLEKAVSAGDWQEAESIASSSRSREVVARALRLAGEGKRPGFRRALRRSGCDACLVHATDVAADEGDWAEVGAYRIHRSRAARERALQRLAGATKGDVDAAIARGDWEALTEIGRFGGPEASVYAVDASIATGAWRFAKYVGGHGKSEGALHAAERAHSEGKRAVFDYCVRHNDGEFASRLRARALQRGDGELAEAVESARRGLPEN
jgi:hypothetical protein